MKYELHRRVKKALSTPEYIRILTLRTVGNFLIYMALFIVGRAFYEPVASEIRYFADYVVDRQYVVADVVPETQNQVVVLQQSPSPTPTSIPTPVPNAIAGLLNIDQVQVIQPADTNFGLVIPKIAANVKVVQDVNAAEKDEYLEALKNGVAHASGTAYPGEGGHVYLFAHSTDYWWNVGQYNAVFYMLYKLETGDEIDIFYNNERIVYKVIGQQVVEPSQVEYLTRQSDTEFLTLQTCWPPGTTLKRLLVFAVPASQYDGGVIR